MSATTPPAGASVPPPGPPAPDPWTGVYPPGVPATYRIPDVALTRLLDDAVRDAPHHPALATVDRALDHHHLARLSGALAASLREAGVRPRDRVVVAVDGPLTLPAVLLAVWRVGGVAVLADPAGEGSGRAVAAAGDRASVTAIVATRRMLRSVADEADLVRVQVDGDRWLDEATTPARRSRWRPARWVRRPPVPETPFEEPTDPGSPAEGRRAGRRARPIGQLVAGSQTGVVGGLSGPDDVAIEWAGSDERGFTHRQLLAGAFQTRLWVPDVQAAQERLLVVGSWVDVQVLVTGWLTGLLSAATVLPVTDATPASIARTIDREEPTLLVARSQELRALWRDEEALAGRALSSLRVVLGLGRPLGPALTARAERRTRGARVRILAVPLVGELPTHGQPVYGRVPAEVAGLPLPSTRARVVGLDGSERPPGTPGRLEVQGPQLRNPGWQSTPCAASMDPTGVFHVLGPVDDVLVDAEGWVGPGATEAHLLEHAGVLDAVVVRRGDATTGDLVAAVVVARRGRPTPEELTAHCADGLAEASRPAAVVVLDELPRTSEGPVDRHAVRERLASA